MALIRVEQPKKTTMSKLAFLQRFTVTERVAIRASTDPIVLDFMELLGIAQDVDTTYPDTVSAINYIESLGLIDTGRAAAILN
jgi:hypothetical protein